MARIFTTEISDSQCIGDSLGTINNNYLNLDNECQKLDTNVDSISAYTNNVKTGLEVKSTYIDTYKPVKFLNGTTGTRPASPEIGMVRYNTDISLLEYYNGTTWLPVGYTKYDYTGRKGYVVTGVTYNGITPVNTYNLGTIWNPSTNQLPSDTIAVKLNVQYTHNGSTNHGYWDFAAYQTGFQSNSAEYVGRHYDWYYNTTWEEFTVPWNSSANSNLVIATRYSYNTSTSNTYSVYLQGVIRGTRL